MFFKKKIDKQSNIQLIKIAALMIHAGKIDENFSHQEEMIIKKVDWQLHIFGDAMHSFTNPEANDPDFGAVYSKNADARSWKIFTDLLSELF